MTYVVSVAEIEAAKNLEYDAARYAELIEAARVALELVEQVVVHELEHEVETSAPPEHLEQVHQVLVAERLQAQKHI